MKDYYFEVFNLTNNELLREYTKELTSCNPDYLYIKVLQVEILERMSSYK